jgi:hypothetical protein
MNALVDVQYFIFQADLSWHHDKTAISCVTMPYTTNRINVTSTEGEIVQPGIHTAGIDPQVIL